MKKNIFALIIMTFASSTYANDDIHNSTSLIVKLSICSYLFSELRQEQTDPYGDKINSIRSELTKEGFSDEEISSAINLNIASLDEIEAYHNESTKDYMIRLYEVELNCQSINTL